MVIKGGSPGPKRLTGAGTPATPWDYGKEFEFYARARESLTFSPVMVNSCGLGAALAQEVERVGW